MDSRMLAGKIGIEPGGQRLLWEDDDYVLRRSPFKSVDPEFDREAVVHWWMNVFVPNGTGEQNTPFEVYTSWNRALHQNFRYIMTDGYSPETGQQGIQVAFVKNGPLQGHLDELKAWLPHIKVSGKGHRGRGVPPCRYVGIFEESLSEHGSYDLVVEEDGCRIKL